MALWGRAGEVGRVKSRAWARMGPLAASDGQPTRAGSDPTSSFQRPTQLSMKLIMSRCPAEGLGSLLSFRDAGSLDVGASNALLWFFSSILSPSLDVPPFFHLTHHGTLGLTVALKLTAKTRIREAWVQVPALPLTRCVTLGKSLYSSGPPLPYL